MLEPAAFQAQFGAALAGIVPPPSDVALARALTVHRNTAAKAAQDALADNYPVVRQLLGDEAFAAAAFDFVAANPPADPRLCFYGAGFDVFVRNYPPFAKLGYLSSVAGVERLYIEALFAADAPVHDGATIAAALDLDMPLALHPALRFASYDSPVVSIWLAHQEDAVVDRLDDLAWSAQAVLVTRPDGALIVTEIDAATTAFLTACADGQPLGIAAAAAGGDLSTLFSTLITVGAFVRHPVPEIRS